MSETAKKGFIGWLKEMHSEACGKASHKRGILTASFFFAVALCFIGLFYEISKPVETVAIFLVTAAFGLNGLGKFAEVMEAKEKHEN